MKKLYPTGKPIIVILGILVLLTGGCTTAVTQAIHDYGTETDFRGDVEQFLGDWGYISGAIDAIWSERKTEFDWLAIDSKKAIDDIWQKKQDDTDYIYTDRDIGQTWGYAHNLLTTAVSEGLKTFAPDVFSMIPVGLL